MAYYDFISKGYNKLHGEEQLKKIKIILKELNICKKKVLDVGCGTALYSYLFSDYTGLDNSKSMLKNSKGNVVFGEAENLPFKDKSFDVVVSLSAAHNFNDFKKAINEMNRVAKEEVVISLFKRAKKFNDIKSYFKADKQIDEEKDLILIKYLNK